jgi:hypothetical protein
LSRGSLVSFTTNFTTSQFVIGDRCTITNLKTAIYGDYLVDFNPLVSASSGESVGDWRAQR